MRWIDQLTYTALALLCVGFGMLIPDNVSNWLIGGIKAFHKVGFTTLISAIAAIAAVRIAQTGLAELQRDGHRQDIETRKWENLR